MRKRKLLALSIGTLVCAACAGAPPPKTEGDAKPEAPATPQSPAERCLNAAGARRERKPNEPERVSVRHVLVRYKGAKNAAETITRSREEACLRASEARDKMMAGADFDAIVTEYSDEAGAAERRGLVGTVTRSEVAPPFADAAFELSIQQMSDVVETDRGFHLILRTE